ncbi:unnamed protein product [Callosobruchus maculatus]|nr:unnamed protein product [Callosobruchus maculatus]
MTGAAEAAVSGATTGEASENRSAIGEVAVEEGAASGEVIGAAAAASGTETVSVGAASNNNRIRRSPSTTERKPEEVLI